MIAEAFTALDSCSEPLSNFWVMSKWQVTAASFYILEAALVDEGELHEECVYVPRGQWVVCLGYSFNVDTGIALNFFFFSLAYILKMWQKSKLSIFPFYLCFLPALSSVQCLIPFVPCVFSYVDVLWLALRFRCPRLAEIAVHINSVF